MTRLWLIAIASLCGCYAPGLSSGDLQCARSGACPSGYHCVTELNRCWKNGLNPDLAQPDLLPPADMSVGPDLAPCVPSGRDCRSSLDNDCDGIPDNQEPSCAVCSPIGDSSCMQHAQDGIGACRAGVQTCSLSPDKASVSITKSCNGSVGPSSMGQIAPIPWRNCASNDFSSVDCWDYDCDGVVEMGYAINMPAGCDGGTTIDAWCKQTYDIQQCTAVEYGPYFNSWYSTDPKLQGCGQKVCVWKCFYGNSPSYPYCQGWGDTVIQTCH
jgi:hypothetical protein